MLAVELVPLDIGEHAVGEADHLIVGRLVLFGVEQLSVVGDELVALAHQLFGWPLDVGAGLDLLDVAGKRGERHRQVVVPAAVIVIEAVARADVEPGVTAGLQLLEPGLARIADRIELGQHGVDVHPVLEVLVDSQFDRAAGEAFHFLVGAEDLGFHACDHAADRLVADLGEGLLAEIEEGHVRAVAEQQELEVVVPHPVVALDLLLVDLEQRVVAGDTLAGVRGLERFVVGQ